MSVQLQYALVNGVKTLPRQENKKPLHGICPHCGGEVVAKIYQDRMSHWAHLNSKMCDKWWESKTPWHIQWQNLFPKEWQEVRVDNPNDADDWHIADVCTSDGLVVEFQHSTISDFQREEREKFYTTFKNDMIWVVFAGGKANRKHFIKNVNDDAWTLKFTLIEGILLCLDPFNDTYFPRAWTGRDVVTFFDLRVGDVKQDEIERTDVIYCLLPYRILKENGWALTYVTESEFRKITNCNERYQVWKKNIFDVLYRHFDGIRRKKEIQEQEQVKSILEEYAKRHSRRGNFWL